MATNKETLLILAHKCSQTERQVSVSLGFAHRPFEFKVLLLNGTGRRIASFRLNVEGNEGVIQGAQTAPTVHFPDNTDRP